MLTLLYGRNGWFGPLLQQAGINVVFAFGGAPPPSREEEEEGEGEKSRGVRSPFRADSGALPPRRPAGMALATMFVTLPFVVRELIPILETMDLSQVGAPGGRGRGRRLLIAVGSTVSSAMRHSVWR